MGTLQAYIWGVAGFNSCPFCLLQEIWCFSEPIFLLSQGNDDFMVVDIYSQLRVLCPPSMTRRSVLDPEWGRSFLLRLLCQRQPVAFWRHLERRASSPQLSGSNMREAGKGTLNGRGRGFPQFQSFKVPSLKYSSCTACPCFNKWTYFPNTAKIRFCRPFPNIKV